MKSALLFSLLLCVVMSVSLLAQASVTLSPSSYNFGSTPVDTGTAWVTFTLANSGSSAVSISNVTVSGPFEPPEKRISCWPIWLLARQPQVQPRTRATMAVMTRSTSQQSPRS